MSGSSVLEKYLRRSAMADSGSFETLVPEASESEGCFGYLRGQRERAIHIELIRKDGVILAPGYAWIEQMMYDPSGVIKLQTSRQTITITGRNLNRGSGSRPQLYAALTRHRVAWIKEADEGMVMQAGDQDTIIEQIKWDDDQVLYSG